jgi:hypothetical protein
VDSDSRNAGGPFRSTSPRMGHSPSVHRNRSVLVRNYSAVTQEAVLSVMAIFQQLIDSFRLADNKASVDRGVCW